MKISENTLKKIIKEEVLREISLTTMYSAKHKAESLYNYEDINDVHYATFGDIYDFLIKFGGQKGDMMAGELDKIAEFVLRKSKRNINISTGYDNQLDATLDSLGTKIVGCPQPLGNDNGEQRAWRDKFYELTDGKTTDEVRREFNLTDDEVYAFENGI